MHQLLRFYSFYHNYSIFKSSFRIAPLEALLYSSVYLAFLCDSLVDNMAGHVRLQQVGLPNIVIEINLT
jgi:hypothetical protein